MAAMTPQHQTAHRPKQLFQRKCHHNTPQRQRLQKPKQLFGKYSHYESNRYDRVRTPIHMYKHKKQLSRQSSTKHGVRQCLFSPLSSPAWVVRQKKRMSIVVKNKQKLSSYIDNIFTKNKSVKETGYDSTLSMSMLDINGSFHNMTISDTVFKTSTPLCTSISTSTPVDGPTPPTAFMTLTSPVGDLRTPLPPPSSTRCSISPLLTYVTSFILKNINHTSSVTGLGVSPIVPLTSTPPLVHLSPQGFPNCQSKLSLVYPPPPAMGRSQDHSLLTLTSEEIINNEDTTILFI